MFRPITLVRGGSSGLVSRVVVDFLSQAPDNSEVMIALDGPYCPHIHGADDAPRRVPWKIQQRRLAHYLLVTCLEGSENLRIGNQELSIQPGQSYLVQPNLLADLESRRGNRPIWLHFDLVYSDKRDRYRCVDAFEAELGDRVELLQPGTQEIFGVELPVLVPKQLTALFRDEVPRIVRRWREHDAMARLDAVLSLSKLLFAWVGQRSREIGLKRPVDVDTRLKQAEELARARLGTPFQVPEFAEAAGFSRSRFSALYRQRRGFSPATFLRNERLRQARHLLVASDTPVGEVGAAVGYPEPTVFGRVFRAHTGSSPKEFRERAHQPASARARSR